MSERVSEMIQRWKTEANKRYGVAVENLTAMETYKSLKPTYGKLPKLSKGQIRKFEFSSSDLESGIPINRLDIIDFEIETKFPLTEYEIRLFEDSDSLVVADVRIVQHTKPVRVNYSHPDFDSRAEFFESEYSAWDSDRLLRRRKRSGYIKQILTFSDYGSNLQINGGVSVEDKLFVRTEFPVASKYKVWKENMRFRFRTDHKNNEAYLRDAKGLMRRISLIPLQERNTLDSELIELHPEYANFRFEDEVNGAGQSIRLR